MLEIDWSRIDDHLFVELTGDLLSRLGFVDIDYQGDGSDGGIDLFATELVPFAIQGRTPFRWAIQCKFSKKAGQASVNDNEVRDVEGILRSERYQGQAPRGYMLVTNRHIVQNVIERLRGIDRNSSFRTARLDYSQLVSLLLEHPEIIDRYFSHLDEIPLSLGFPDAVISSKHDGQERLIPTVTIRVQDLNSTKPPITTHAVLDTAAEVSVIPTSIIEKLEIPPIDCRKVQVFGGVIRNVLVYFINLSIEGGDFGAIKVLGADTSRALIGQDVLTLYSILIQKDGTIRLYKR